MKKLFIFLYIIMALSAKADYWTQKANFSGAGLYLTFSFSIGSKGYVGAGAGWPQGQFWEFDPATNTWTQKADFGGGGRILACGFSIGNKGYAGLGSGSSIYQDFWEYDPSNNIWTQKADFSGGKRSGPWGFSIGNFGYVGAGLDTFAIMQNDLWQYDPITNIWLQKANFLGPTRWEANYFVIANNGYLLCGDDGTNFLSDLWEYNSISDTWSQKANFPGNPRCDAAAFTICDKGYFGTGEFILHTFYEDDFWRYNPVTNSWNQKTNFTGLARDESAFFSIGTKGYIGLGGEDAWLSGVAYNDFWEYTPDSACATSIEEIANDNLPFTISPNPAHQYAVISWQPAENKNVELLITTLEGKIVPFVETDNYPSLQPQHEIKINLHNFPKGIYLVQIISNKKVSGTQKLMIE